MPLGTERRLTFKEIACTLRKDALRGLPAHSIMHLYVFVHTWTTWLLLRVGMNSRQCTVLWFIVALAGYGVLTIGAPWAFVVGGLAVFCQQVLDGSDGEIGRHESRFMSRERDVRTHINGIYLDRLFHVVNSSLWGLALAFGIYRCTGETIAFAAGIAMIVFHLTHRMARDVEADLAAQFEDVVVRIMEDQGFRDLRRQMAKPQSLAARALGTIRPWIATGRRLNLLFLAAGVTDVALHLLHRDSVGQASLTVLVLTGILGFMLAVYRISSTVRNDAVVRGILDRHKCTDWAGSEPEFRLSTNENRAVRLKKSARPDEQSARNEP